MNLMIDSMEVQENLPFIEFDCPREERWQFGLNPRVAGYRKRIATRSTIFVVACALLGMLGCGLSAAQWLSPLAGLALFAACAFSIILLFWMRFRTEFCTLCGARTKHALSKQPLTWCPGCYNLNDPAQIGVRVSDVFDVTQEETFYHIDPIPRFLAMTICLAMLDKGHKITYEPMEGRYGVGIAIDDKIYELEDPPAHIHFAVAQTVKAMAGLDMANCSETQEGRLNIRVYERLVSADVLVQPMQFGQKVVLRWLGKAPSTPTTPKAIA